MKRLLQRACVWKGKTLWVHSKRKEVKKKTNCHCLRRWWSIVTTLSKLFTLFIILMLFDRKQMDKRYFIVNYCIFSLWINSLESLLHTLLVLPLFLIFFHCSSLLLLFFSVYFILIIFTGAFGAHNQLMSMLTSTFVASEICFFCATFKRIDFFFLFAFSLFVFVLPFVSHCGINELRHLMLLRITNHKQHSYSNCYMVTSISYVSILPVIKALIQAKREATLKLSWLIISMMVWSFVVAQ